MSRRVMALAAFGAILLVGGISVPASAADQSPPLITIELAKVPLSQVIQLLNSNGGIDVVFNDPEGKLAAVRRETPGDAARAVE